MRMAVVASTSHVAGSALFIGFALNCPLTGPISCTLSRSDSDPYPCHTGPLCSARDLLLFSISPRIMHGTWAALPRLPSHVCLSLYYPYYASLYTARPPLGPRAGLGLCGLSLSGSGRLGAPVPSLLYTARHPLWSGPVSGYAVSPCPARADSEHRFPRFFTSPGTPSGPGRSRATRPLPVRLGPTRSTGTLPAHADSESFPSHIPARLGPTRIAGGSSPWADSDSSV
jgi:hypothetical protein